MVGAAVNPKRRRFNFWLDVESGLADLCDQLIKRRLFSRTIRDGIRLIVDLRAGKIDVLRELFPNIVDKIIHDTIGEKLDLLLQRPVVSSVPVARPSSASLDDLPEIEVTVAKVDLHTNNSAFNLMITSALNIVGDISHLPGEMLEYGVRMGKIPKRMITPELQKRIDKYLGSQQSSSEVIEDEPALAPGQASGSAKVMDVPQFEAPNFDDLLEGLE